MENLACFYVQDDKIYSHEIRGGVAFFFLGGLVLGDDEG